MGPEIFFVLGGLVIGVSLGLMGSGGSILTVPLLVYLLGHQNKTAIAESLAIVGAIALAAAIPYARQQQIDWRSVLFFGLPGMAGAWLGANIAAVVPGVFQLLLFAVVMLLAAVMMFRGRPAPSEKNSASAEAPGQQQAAWKIALEGAGVGVLTGLVGVGGGFLIVPALVLLGHLPMRMAVGTSLIIIALNSATGFVESLRVIDLSVDWLAVGIFVAVGIAGSFAGSLLSARLNQALLRRIFAVFLLAMAVLVIAKETPNLFSFSAAPPDGASAAQLVDPIPLGENP